MTASPGQDPVIGRARTIRESDALVKRVRPLGVEDLVRQVIFDV